MKENTFIVASAIRDVSTGAKVETMKPQRPERIYEQKQHKKKFNGGQIKKNYGRQLQHPFKRIGH